MATLCLRRLCTRSSPIFRQIYTCEALAAAPSFLTHRDLTLIKYSTPISTCGYAKLIPQPSSIILRHYTDKVSKKIEEKKPEKKSLLQRFKQMYRDYWYVLVPVHLVTSAAWFGGFYYLAKSGVDIAGLLESWNVTERITNSLRDSSMGYLAVSYALYKIATPLRYTVTLGGTTVSINYLKKWGYIKPVPSTDALREMYKEHKENIIETIREKRDFYKEKKDNIIEETKMELKMQKDQLKDHKNLLVKDFEKGLEKIKKAKADLSTKPDDLIKISKKDESG